MTQTAAPEPTLHGLVQKLVEGFNDMVMQDWSMSGSSVSRHVDFGEDPPPLTPGRHLGMSNGTVTEVKCRGTSLAKKTYNVGPMSTQRERDVIELRKEVQVLRRLRHKHIIELVGSYTYGSPQQLEVLFWPVAVCSLSEFMHDIYLVLRYYKANPETPVIDIPTETGLHVDRLLLITNTTLTPTGKLDDIVLEAGRRVAASFGCLAEAVSYMHGQGVRHKDIKPSNILIFPSNGQYSVAKDGQQGGETTILDGIRLTDFDGSKAWGHEDNSKTADTFGTEGYRPPEVPSGRSGDVYSLGRVYENLRSLMSQTPGLHVGAELRTLIAEMCNRDDPDARPKANQLSLRLCLIDQTAPSANNDVPSLFGRCCQPVEGFFAKHANMLNLALASPRPQVTIRRNAKGLRIDVAAREVVPKYDRQKFSEVENYRPCNSYYLLGGSCQPNCTYRHDMPRTEENVSILRTLRRRLCCEKGHACDLPYCVYGHHCTQNRETGQAPDGTAIQSCIHGGPPPMGQCRFPDYVHNIDTEVATWTVHRNPPEDFGRGRTTWPFQSFPHSPSPVGWYPPGTEGAMYEGQVWVAE
ncbi:hypothetical protein NW759_013452 [Fusarium solani]|jgi:serine/threonine protein kinase|uniref:Kinase-like domain-containing protein n=1 Tax=Fusarium solani TaxID=169388 RepID=A0A9P9KB14_FUSSL|nr:kinase-like domain-containing protein [Fusarium solani]KAH7254623.1 kinase-like domain-containing protein [Fusarium solani]KAJ4209597.1 hypothetical protein NW759_013452 [Fusarium solani]